MHLPQLTVIRKEARVRKGLIDLFQNPSDSKQACLHSSLLPVKLSVKHIVLLVLYLHALVGGHLDHANELPPLSRLLAVFKCCLLPS